MSEKTIFSKRIPVDLEFVDLSYSVPQGRKGSKLILRGVNGKFLSGQLTAIMGPSGAGKSTLLNILAGYKFGGVTGAIYVNGQERNEKSFRKLSRYIMQHDLVQPQISVWESMEFAANLKLNATWSEDEKICLINEILDTLGLSGSKNTYSNYLSGGQRKRLAIAIELVNNPPVLFLDEPTTGLDDLSCAQCIKLLKLLAEGGRTVICSIHTPSAKLFSIFDNVYVVSSGQCVYQGYASNVVGFLSSMGLVCPKTYNPADFLIEVCSGEYGNFQDKMVTQIENGRNNTYCQYNEKKDVDLEMEAKYLKELEESESSHKGSSSFAQFTILLRRMMKQFWRNKAGLFLRTFVFVFLGLLIGNVYIGIGNDGSKSLFNFGFFYVCTIFFMYVPMMPVLLHFPMELQQIKREHFNQWYQLKSYFWAHTVAYLPILLILSFVYIIIIYLCSGQPMELDRFLLFYLICILTGMISETIGLIVGMLLDVVNALFIGTVIKIPLMLLAVYGFGSGIDDIPLWVRISMQLSYLRYTMEGLMVTMLTGRIVVPCPDSEEFCAFNDVGYLMRITGMNHAVLWVDVIVLVFVVFLSKLTAYFLLKNKLKRDKKNGTLHYIGQIIKSHVKS